MSLDLLILVTVTEIPEQTKTNYNHHGDHVITTGITAYESVPIHAIPCTEADTHKLHTSAMMGCRGRLDHHLYWTTFILLSW